MSRVSDEVRELVKRRIDQGNALSDRAIAALDTLPPEAVKEIARLLLHESRYLGEHFPSEREQLDQLSCSAHTWCIGDYGGECSGHTATPATWCPVSGFDCWTCHVVDELQRILEAHA